MFLFIFSYEIVCQCWVEDPAKRSNFKELVVTITKSLEGIAGYMDFTMSASQSYDHLTKGSNEYSHVRSGLKEDVNV